MTEREADLMRALHDEHAPALWSYALRLASGDHSRAQDIVQETLLRAWRTPRILDQSAGSARSWLMTVAHRIAIDQWRSSQLRPEVATENVPETASPDRTDQALESWLVSDALRSLTSDHRQVIVECFYLGHSATEAAIRLGIPAGTVKSRTHYALRALRLALQERGVSQ